VTVPVPSVNAASPMLFVQLPATFIGRLFESSTPPSITILPASVHVPPAAMVTVPPPLLLILTLLKLSSLPPVATAVPLNSTVEPVEVNVPAVLFQLRPT